MKPVIDLEECLQDSPPFREAIEQNAEDVELLESKLEKLVRLCNGMVEAGKAFTNSQQSFVVGIQELSLYFHADSIIVSALQRFIQELQEVTKYQSILIDQAQRSVVRNVNKFVKNDIKHVKDTKRHFEKISDDFDNALVRNSQAPKSKTHECDEANNLLTAVRSCFRYTALDYVQQLSSLQSKKRYEVLDTLLSMMHAYTTYFHQGSDLFQDVDPYLKQLDTTLNRLRDESSELEKELEGRHLLVTQKDFVPTMLKTDDSTNSRVKLQGYLFKRTTNAFKTWNRRWFIIQNNQLVYRKRSPGDALTVMEEDLRLCTVKPANDIDRRFCFEVVSPSKSHMLQADSDESCQQWISAMQAGINAALHHSNSEDQPEKGSNRTSSDRPCSVSPYPPPPKPPRAHSQILSIPGNDLCCDCKSAEPRWASINLGITLCIECSGIHRSLGVHLSKVRSLTLDAWEPELLKVMAELGNNISNDIFEAKVDETVAVRATHDCSRPVRELWIKAKYVKRSFVQPLLDSSNEETENLIDTGGGDTTTTTNLQVPRRWGVKKISRRKKKRLHLSEDDQDKRLSVASDSSVPSLGPGSSVSSVETSSPVQKSLLDIVVTDISTTEDELSKDLLMFGDVIMTDMSLDLDSADESPTVDDDDEIGNEMTPTDDIKNLNPDRLLYRAAAVHNLPAMLQALATKADPNWRNPEDKGQTPLHQAIRSGSIMACEFLLLNGVKCNTQDDQGRTVLHLATQLGHTGQVCLLLKRGVDQSMLDSLGKDALALAVDEANADIVTLLRLARLNEEMRRDEFGNPGDETFNEVVRDFSHMASHNPEKLRRQPSAAET